MRLIVICLVVGMHFSVYAVAQKVTLNHKDAQLTTILKEIKKQTGYNFLYDAEAIQQAPKVSLDLHAASIKETLDHCFKELSLQYIIQGNNVIISKKGIESTHNFEAQQQQRTIRGTVRDEKGEPLPGVNVQIKNATRGTVASSDGSFVIVVPEANSILVFTYIGFAVQEIPTLGKTEVNVVLKEQSNDLNEIVVVGYGTQRKADLTGAIGTLQGAKIAERNVTQTSLALQGAVPGLTVSRSNGAPGTSSTLRIRGITTIGDSNPLILVDGIPTGSIDNVNPSDIENISVLKDAAAASIYGSKAAAGVILVTTKKGQQGKTDLDFSHYYGIERPSNLPEFVNAQRYMEMVNELRWNDINNLAGGEHPVYSQSLIDDYMNLNSENPDMYPNTDWLDMLYKDKATRQSYLINVSGGNEKARTRVSLGYDKVDGIYIGKGYDLLRGRVNNDFYITKKLKASLNTSFKRQYIKNPSETPYLSAYRSAPIYAAVWTNGLVAEGKSGNNMYAQLLEGGYNNNWQNLLATRASLTFEPIQGLSFTGIVSPELEFNKTKEFRKIVQYTNYDNPNEYVGSTDWGRANSLSETRYEGSRITSQLLANYNKTVRLHNFGVLAGFEHYLSNHESLGASSNNLLLNSFPYLDLGNSNFLSNSGNATQSATTSYFGRLNYSLADKYLLQANIRMDGSSKFHKDYRWGTFPSLSAGWVLSKEKFFPRQNVITFLKLRGSYGVLGNERIGTYPYQSTISFAETLLYQGTDITAVQTAAQQAYAIENITWETTTSYNGGLDLALMKDKFNLSFDVYRKNTKDMLLALDIPKFMGYDNADQNAGRMHTTGWELIANWKDNVNDFRYGVSVNLSDAVSIIDDLKGIQFLGNNIKIAGSEFNEWYGYKSLGIFQTREEINQSPLLAAGVAPGDLKYQDISGPDGVPDGKISAEYDRVPLGGSLPRFTYGGNLELGYKNIDLSVSFQGVAKQTALLTANMIQPYQNSWGNMPAEIDGKYWSVYNTEEQNLNAKYPRLSNNYAANNYAVSDFRLFDGSYFRLKNIVLGYRFSDEVLNKIFLKGLRVYVSAHDILSMHKYPKGWDPEIGNESYPIMSSINFGVSVKF